MFNLPEIEIETKVPEDYPTFDLPKLEIPTPVTDIPNNPPMLPPKPELNIGVPNLPGEFPPTVPEKPRLEIGIVPNEAPKNEKPELELPIPPASEVPNTPEAPTPETPENETPEETMPPTYSRVARNSEVLPNTGDSESAFAEVTGIATILGAFGLVSKRRRKED